MAEPKRDSKAPQGVVLRAEHLRGDSLCVRFRAEAPTLRADNNSNNDARRLLHPTRPRRELKRDASHIEDSVGEVKPYVPIEPTRDMPAEPKRSSASVSFVERGLTGRPKGWSAASGLGYAAFRAQQAAVEAAASKHVPMGECAAPKGAPTTETASSKRAPTAAPLAQLDEGKLQPRGGRRTVPTAAMLAACRHPEPGLRVFSRVSPKSWLTGVIDKILSNDIVRIAYDDGTAQVTQWDPKKFVVEPPSDESCALKSPKKRKLDSPINVELDAVLDETENQAPGLTGHFLAHLVIEPRENIALRAILDLRCSRPLMV